MDKGGTSLPFSDLGLSKGLVEAMAKLGYAEPFPIQSMAMPLILSGRDLVAQARTGSGKTIAFAAPILEKAIGARDRRGSSVAALVLVPTRELADQVGEVFSGLARAARLPLVLRVAHGGSAVNPQMLALRGGADVLVATPGRLLDLAGRKAARLGAVEILVLDEADRMLNLGFRDELASILALLPARRQTLLFSATMSEALGAISEAALHDPESIVAEGGTHESLAGPAGEGEARPARIEELAYAVGNDEKGPFLRKLLAEGKWEKVLVFTSSNRRADNVARKLNNNGLAAASFHGGLSQQGRTGALADFRSGRTRILVASDLASRGLDIEGLPCVVNYELPRSPLDYVHRIGRTGRAGESGLAISLVSPEEEAMLRLIERKSHLRITLVRDAKTRK